MSRKKEVFISYSRSDTHWLEQLKPHLKQLTLQHNFHFWVDTETKPGEEWKKEIDGYIANCEVALLLVSTQFLASDFINNEEIPRILLLAKRRGVKIFVLVLDFCVFDSESPLYKYQCLNDPEKPLEDLDEISVKKIFVQTAKEIRTVLMENREDKLAEFGGLPMDDYLLLSVVLAALVESKDEQLSIADLMELVTLERGTVIKLLFLLEEKGFVSKERAMEERKKRLTTMWRVSDMGFNFYQKFKSSLNAVLDRTK